MNSILRPILCVLTALCAGAAASAAAQEAVPASAIRAIVEARCVSCHGPEKSKGELRLDLAEHVSKGGENGPVVVAGKPAESKLYTLTTLPADDPDIMPAKGDPLTKEQTDLIKAWIEQGANLDGWDTAPAPQTTAAPAEAAKADPLTALAEGVAPAPQEAIAALQALGAIAMPLDATTPLLRVDFSLTDQDIDDDKLQSLAGVAQQVTWLNLANTEITDAGLAQVAALPRLTRLHLEKTGVTDGAIAHLAGLQHLEYLNLYATKVSDAGVAQLAGLKSLKRLFLWQSQATKEGAAQLAAVLPGIDINLGWEEAAPTSESAAPVNLAAVFEKDGCCAKAAAEGKICDHPCCVEATAAGKACAKCNPGAEAKLALSKLFAADGCCAKTFAEGKACDHPCCVEAAAAGKVCTKCNPEPAAPAVNLTALFEADGCCAKAAAAGKACDHPCCVEAAAAGKACAKCNPGAEAKLKRSKFFDADGCCATAFAAGKACDHPCCVEAAAAGRVCPKCNAKTAATILDLAAAAPAFDDNSCCAVAAKAGGACDHPCCKEAAKAGKVCTQCNPGKA